METWTKIAVAFGGFIVVALVMLSAIADAGPRRWHEGDGT